MHSVALLVSSSRPKQRSLELIITFLAQTVPAGSPSGSRPGELPYVVSNPRPLARVAERRHRCIHVSKSNLSQLGTTLIVVPSALGYFSRLSKKVYTFSVTEESYSATCFGVN
jgi:hypothetical protein